jgi:DNA (cytosine-5)-methyltransferase 1
VTQLTHGSLFAGIGGFDLGFERAGMRTVWQVEIDEYCRRVLAKHFPDAYQFGDIRECCGLRDSAHYLSCQRKNHLQPIDVITGGFPCQDISLANDSRSGLAGSRSGLWSEYARIIGELRPRYAVVENVAALLIPVRDANGAVEQPAPISRVLGDLADLGYDAEWDRLPATGFGAHHVRERVFIIAYRSDARRLRSQGSWPTSEKPWSGEQFEGLVQAELRLSVPAGKSGGISDGLPDRIHRLKSLGNAVVPQIAEWIGRRIAVVTAGAANQQ